METGKEKNVFPQIFYFRLEQGRAAKQHVWCPPRLPVMDLDMGKDGALRYCQVPEYYTGRREWECGKLTECLEGVLRRYGQECRTCYFQPEVGSLAGIREKLPPEELLRKVFRQAPCWEYLLFIGEEDGDGAEQEECRLLPVLLGEYLPRINHFTLITGQPELYGDFTEYLYEEYGIPTAYMNRMERRLGRDGKTVILDGKRDYRIPWSVISKGAVYVDLWSMDGKRMLLQKMRRDVRYMSAVTLLDTLAENRYNTIVNHI